LSKNEPRILLKCSYKKCTFDYPVDLLYSLLIFYIKTTEKDYHNMQLNFLIKTAVTFP